MHPILLIFAVHQRHPDHLSAVAAVRVTHHQVPYATQLQSQHRQRHHRSHRRGIIQKSIATNTNINRKNKT